MSAKYLAATLFLVAATTLPAQDIGLQIGSGLGVSGSLCDPWSCTPATVSGAAGTTLAVQVRGATFQPHSLLLSAAPAQCVTLPGIARSLILRPPGQASFLPLNWGRLYITGPGPICAGWIGTTRVLLPATAPRGARFLLQALAPVPLAPGGQWTFSNAVQLTVL